MGYEVVAEESPSCLITPDVGRTRTGGGGIPSVDANDNKLKAVAATATFDDASTTRTEVSTDIDDMSSLREKLLPPCRKEKTATAPGGDAAAFGGGAAAPRPPRVLPPLRLPAINNEQVII